MSRSIRTLVSKTINDEVYNDNLVRLRLDNMEMYDSVVEQLNEIDEMIVITTEYVNTTAITDLSNLKIDAAALRAQNSIIEPTIASLQTEVELIEQTTNLSDLLKIDKKQTFIGNITFSSNVFIQPSSMSGFIRVDGTGALSSGFDNTLIRDEDISVTAAIVDSKLQTISAPGKVATSATSAQVYPFQNSIMLRDASANLYALTSTQPADPSNTTIATTAYVKNAYSQIIGNSPETLDTLKELAAALGNDSNYAVNVMNSISQRANKTEPILTGNTQIGNVTIQGLVSANIGLLASNAMGILRKDAVTSGLTQVSIPDSMLETISAPGKVANSATTATVEMTSNSIVARDASGGFGTMGINGTLIQNRSLLLDPSKSDLAGPISQGYWGWPMPSKTVIESATTKWTLREGANTNPCTSLCWAPDLNLLVGTAYSSFIIVSTSGTSWQERDTGYANNWNDMVWAYHLGLLVAVASSGDNRVMTSPDGITWTLQNTVNRNYSWGAIICADELNLLVAVSADVGNSIMTSTDAINWVMPQYSGPNGFRCVCWAKELRLFVAPEYNAGGSGNSVAVSYDGNTWVRVANVLTNSIYWSICWSPERRLFVAVGGPNNIAVSSTGFQWTNLVIANAQGTLQKVVWSSELGVFVILCSGAANRNMFWVSETGKHWKVVQAPVFPTTPVLTSQALVWSPELSIFCCVTSNGTLQEKVLTSTLSARLVNPNTVFNSPYMSIDNTGNWTIPKIQTGNVRINNLNTQGVTNQTRPLIAQMNFSGNGRLGMQIGAYPGYVFTSMDNGGTGMWLPHRSIIHQWDGSITSRAIDTWTDSGQVRNIGNITLPPGSWTIQYRTIYETEPTYGTMAPTAGPITTELTDSDFGLRFRYSFNEI